MRGKFSDRCRGSGVEIKEHPFGTFFYKIAGPSQYKYMTILVKKYIQNFLKYKGITV